MTLYTMTFSSRGEREICFEGTVPNDASPHASTLVIRRCRLVSSRAIAQTLGRVYRNRGKSGLELGLELGLGARILNLLDRAMLLFLDS